ncbi:MAG: holin family protein [Pseudomonadota bacterium]
MGIINRILGIGRTAKDLSEVFVANRTEADAHAMRRFSQAQEAYRAEFATATRFDYFVNGLNRLPRPFMALGTIGLFAFAMADPIAFSVRMQGLSYIPEPLWWLLGAIVSFYFGARELHHFRSKPPLASPAQKLHSSEDQNAALEEWRSLQGQRPDWLDGD